GFREHSRGARVRGQGADRGTAGGDRSLAFSGPVETPAHAAKVGVCAAISTAWTLSATARPDGAFRSCDALEPDSPCRLSRCAAARAPRDPEGTRGAAARSRRAGDGDVPARAVPRGSTERARAGHRQPRGAPARAG